MSKHTVILPYFCEAEVDRYTGILEHIKRLGTQRVEFEFLLAASPRIDPSDRLLDAASQVSASRHFACPSQVFGYPEGPSAMFWDCMDHLARQGGREGFALWMESDMCPIKSDWLDRLDADWRSSGDIFVMGCVVPQVNRHQRSYGFARPFSGRRYRHQSWVPQHVNGGACYRKDLVRHLPGDYREGLFDVRLGEILCQLGGYADTPAISFSTLERLESDHADPDKALLHGYLQDKDVFLKGCMYPGQPLDAGPREILPFRKDHPARPKLDAVFSIKDRQPSVLTVYRRRASIPARKSA